MLENMATKLELIRSTTHYTTFSTAMKLFKLKAIKLYVIHVTHL